MAVVLLVPSSLSVIWYIVFGGTAISQHLNGQVTKIEGSGENVMFDVLRHLPLFGLTSILTLIAIIVFFNTAADSATNVMGSMSQSGRSVPSNPVVVTWGIGLGLISLFLLLAGGENALSGLQNIVVSASLPFAIILVGVMVAFYKDLSTDPMIIRRRFARAAIEQGVRRGIDVDGDDLIFGAQHAPESQGAGAKFETNDPAMSDWFTENASEQNMTEVTEVRQAERSEHEKLQDE